MDLLLKEAERSSDAALSGRRYGSIALDRVGFARLRADKAGRESNAMYAAKYSMRWVSKPSRT